MFNPFARRDQTSPLDPSAITVDFRQEKTRAWQGDWQHNPAWKHNTHPALAREEGMQLTCVRQLSRALTYLIDSIAPGGYSVFKDQHPLVSFTSAGGRSFGGVQSSAEIEKQDIHGVLNRVINLLSSTRDEELPKLEQKYQITNSLDLTTAMVVDSLLSYSDEKKWQLPVLLIATLKSWHELNTRFLADQLFRREQQPDKPQYIRSASASVSFSFEPQSVRGLDAVQVSFNAGFYGARWHAAFDRAIKEAEAQSARDTLAQLPLPGGADLTKEKIIVVQYECATQAANIVRTRKDNVEREKLDKPLRVVPLPSFLEVDLTRELYAAAWMRSLVLYGEYLLKDLSPSINSLISNALADSVRQQNAIGRDQPKLAAPGQAGDNPLRDGSFRRAIEP